MISAKEARVEGLRHLYNVRFFRKRFALTDDLLRVVENADAFLECLYIWGVHEKAQLDLCETQTIASLKDLLARLAKLVGIDVVLRVVIADSHGYLNEVSAAVAEQYATSCERLLRAQSWDVQRMSDLWHDAGITQDRINEKADSINVRVEAPRLVQFAARHYKGTSPERGASRYLAARRLEQPIIAGQFPNHILLTAVEPALDSLQPPLPLFHIWTRKKGCSAKPWFSRAVT